MLGLLRRRPKARRDIYEYTILGELRKADPMRIELSMSKALPDWREWAKKLPFIAKIHIPSLPEKTKRQIEEDWNDTIEKLCHAIGKAFGVTPLKSDGKGVTISEMLDLLGNYLTWAQGVKEDARPFSK